MKTKLNQSKLKGAIVSAVLVGTASLTLPAYARNRLRKHGVTANIGMNCTISTADIAFGAYDPIVDQCNVFLDAQWLGNYDLHSRLKRKSNYWSRPRRTGGSTE